MGPSNGEEGVSGAEELDIEVFDSLSPEGEEHGGEKELADGDGEGELDLDSTENEDVTEEESTEASRSQHFRAAESLGI